jgi:hypothetical protein
MYTSQFSSLFVGYGTKTTSPTSDHEGYERYMSCQGYERQRLRLLSETVAESLVEAIFLLVVCMVWLIFWESFKRNSISSYFDKLLEANTVGVRHTISLLQVLLGIQLNY